MASNNLKKFYEFGRKIVCVGRNYREHALELNNPVPEKPLIFAKTANAFVLVGGKIRAPSDCLCLHHEAYDYIGGYTIALDMTARDIQDDLKKAGHPWYLAKSFDSSCPIGEFIDKKKITDPHNLEIYCLVNGQIRQKSKTDCMIFNIPTLLEYITRTITLQPGDLVLTGTPSGVSQCVSGDKLVIGISGITEASFEIE
ncbi:unnamed protein product [Meloidogyne enterolobii]|uniref:Uncharacterized protein n=2 Tax=Meloidogyne enterolobii TaxID=390850 RepID=A0ACB1B021_MELEN